MPPIRLMILWHMHQPYYKDLVEDRYTMPWVRLHALKDYFGMVAMLKDFPSVHQTFNLVPSLVSQLLDYASGAAHGDALDLAFKPAKEMTPEDKQRLVKYAFQVNHENIMSLYPRFWELFLKAKGADSEPEASRISAYQDFLDLQVISQVAWFDEIYLATDPQIKDLVARQRGYTEEDKAVVQAKEIEIIKATLEEYRSASARGQVELSTSPFYHPILPLICDTQAGAESTPGLTLPRQRFRRPEDARAQLKDAVKLHQEVFGAKPAGLWPSEGSVSTEALRIASEEGFEWAATDEGVLGRSLGTFFHRYPDGTVHDGRRLYTPYRLPLGDRSIALFFRDHPISDLIGFVYGRMDPADAARDLVNRVRNAAQSTGGRPAVVSVILDGENAWEYYPANGREFLKRFYDLVSSDPGIQPMTPSEILQSSPVEPLDRLTPGSWINANFNVWIGAGEDNRAWDLLSNARDFLEKNEKKAGVDPRDAELARQEIYIAEGSDWCWWYGPEHSTANDEEFDYLYRKHLSNVYRLLGAPAQDELAAPIKRPRTGGNNLPPTHLIAPIIDGRETTYFEWLGAGVYTPDHRSGSVHAGNGYINQLFYGHNETSIFIRIDLNEEFLKTHRDFEFRLSLSGETVARLGVPIVNGACGEIEFWRGGQKVKVPDETGQGVRVGYQATLEMALDFSALGVDPAQKPGLQVSLWVNQLPVQVAPREGKLNFELSEGWMGW
ncbi:MAG: glycoside hydrolase [Acidobacteriota bacterium]|nr:glycoside hydrolase [Acidobacteriota bacterium]